MAYYPTRAYQPAAWSPQMAIQQASTAMTMQPGAQPSQSRPGRLHRKLRIEHTNFLADDDLSKNLPVRPRSYYDNISRLWAANVLRQANIPWTAPVATVQAAVRQVLVNTQAARLPYSRALGVPGAPGTPGYPYPGVQQPGGPFVSYGPASAYAGPSSTPYGYVPGSDSQDDDYADSEPMEGDVSGFRMPPAAKLKAQYANGITLEQINRLPPKDRQIVKELIRQRLIRIRH